MKYSLPSCLTLAVNHTTNYNRLLLGLFVKYIYRIFFFLLYLPQIAFAIKIAGTSFVSYI